jgi:hypothetical protein
MWLSLRYPLRARDQPIYANATPDQTLRTAVSILEIMMNLYENNPKSSHFKWVGRSWVQWHSLAVILAELCIQTEGPLVPYLLAYKPPLRYKPPSHISPLLAKGRCKICMAHRPSTIVNRFAISPLMREGICLARAT